MRSIRFLDNEMKEKFSRIKMLKEYINSADSQNNLSALGLDNIESPVFISSGLTNLGLFRFYAEAYLRKHPYIDPDQALILRHRAPEGNGLPLQVYLYTKNNTFTPYENIQSEIFEYLIATMNEFGLKVFQHPTGDDVLSLSNTKLD